MSEYNEQRAAFDKAVKTFEGNNSFAAARALLLSGEKTVSFNRKIIEKNIDSSWLKEIEKALPHIDTVIRNPRNTIKEVEEIVRLSKAGQGMQGLGRLRHIRLCAQLYHLLSCLRNSCQRYCKTPELSLKLS